MSQVKITSLIACPKKDEEHICAYKRRSSLFPKKKNVRFSEIYQIHSKGSGDIL